MVGRFAIRKKESAATERMGSEGEELNELCSQKLEFRVEIQEYY
jgi:hypothetical protein